MVGSGLAPGLDRWAVFPDATVTGMGECKVRRGDFGVRLRGENNTSN